MAASPQALDTVSLYSTTSAVSSCPDRHGFYGGFQFSDKPKEPLSRAQVIAREKKWLYMIDNWQEYMSKNYKKIRERCRKGNIHIRDVWAFTFSTSLGHISVFLKVFHNLYGLERGSIYAERIYYTRTIRIGTKNC